MAFVSPRPGLLLSSRAEIGVGVTCGTNVRIWANAIIGDHSIIFDNVEIGAPGPNEVNRFRAAPESNPSLDALDEMIEGITSLGARATIRSNVQIYSGCAIGRDFDCAHFVNIREDCRIGDNVYAKIQTEIRREVVIGDHCVVAGLIGDRAALRNSVVSLGSLVHEFPTGRRSQREPAPVLEQGAFVGRNAVVVGGVVVGEKAYVAAGATVLTDVPAGALIVGCAGRILRNRSPLVRN